MMKVMMINESNDGESNDDKWKINKTGYLKQVYKTDYLGCNLHQSTKP